MHDLLKGLPPNGRVLDLGCAGGSFGEDGTHVVIRLDIEHRLEAGGNFVMADAAQLPFPGRAFDLVIANHSLEHIADLDTCLLEIGRVICAKGGFFVSVPDSSTITDKIYRWLARGGGHVNPFVSSPLLAQKIESLTGLPHTGTRSLCTSLSFMNKHNRRAKAPRRLLLLGGGSNVSLLLLNFLFRWSDRLFKTRLCVYGWALYFGSLQPEGPGEIWTNVCIRCGAGHDAKKLAGVAKFPATYRCPNCDTRNILSNDGDFTHLISR